MAVSVGTVARLGLAALGLTLASAAFGLQSAGSGPEAAAVQPPPGVAAPTAAAMSPEKLQQGRELFNNWGCNSCHVLKDAAASGHVGPALDGNPNLTKALVVDRVTNGQGPMPAFGGQMSDEEIQTVAGYVMQVKK